MCEGSSADHPAHTARGLCGHSAIWQRQWSYSRVPGEGLQGSQLPLEAGRGWGGVGWVGGGPTSAWQDDLIEVVLPVSLSSSVQQGNNRIYWESCWEKETCHPVKCSAWHREMLIRVYKPLGQSPTSVLSYVCRWTELVHAQGCHMQAGRRCVGLLECARGNLRPGSKNMCLGQ